MDGGTVEGRADALRWVGALSRRRWRSFTGGVLLVLTFVGLLLTLPVDWPGVREWAAGVVAWIESASQENPLWLVLALTLLPLACFPATVLLVLCGAHGPWLGFALGWSGIFLNTLVVYALGARVVRGPARRLCRWRGVDVPQVRPEQAARLTLAVRLIPGLPPVFQGLILALAKVPLATYLWVSLALQSVYVLGVILVGASLFQGGSGLAIAGVAVMVGLALLARLYTQRNGRTQSPKDNGNLAGDRPECGRVDAAGEAPAGD